MQVIKKGVYRLYVADAQKLVRPDYVGRADCKVCDCVFFHSVERLSLSGTRRSVWCPMCHCPTDTAAAALPEGAVFDDNGYFITDRGKLGPYLDAVAHFEGLLTVACEDHECRCEFQVDKGDMKVEGVSYSDCEFYHEVEIVARCPECGRGWRVEKQVMAVAPTRS